MPGPSRTVRRPAVAGVFYPADPAPCTAAAEQFVRRPAGVTSPGGPGRTWRGAIVPHAGWVCSGAIAGEAIATLKASRTPAHGSTSVGVEGDPQVVVVFAAVHTPLALDVAVMSTHQSWATPSGTTDVPIELTGKLEADKSNLFGVDDRFHDREHAVEVELPLIQRAWPDAMVLPIEVPLIDEAPEIGRRVSRMVQAMELEAVYLASSDLTHYGPAYGFAPAGVGADALAWAKENDRRLLEVVRAVRPEEVVPHVRTNMNACGGGAIAAMLAACGEYRAASTVEVLRHANSYEVLRDVAPAQAADNAVGYSAVVVG